MLGFERSGDGMSAGDSASAVASPSFVSFVSSVAVVRSAAVGSGLQSFSLSSGLSRGSGTM